LDLVKTGRVIQQRPSEGILEGSQRELDDHARLGVTDEVKRSLELTSG